MSEPEAIGVELLSLPVASTKYCHNVTEQKLGKTTSSTNLRQGSV